MRWQRSMESCSLKSAGVSKARETEQSLKGRSRGRSRSPKCTVWERRNGKKPNEWRVSWCLSMEIRLWVTGRGHTESLWTVRKHNKGCPSGWSWRRKGLTKLRPVGMEVSRGNVFQVLPFLITFFLPLFRQWKWVTSRLRWLVSWGCHGLLLQDDLTSLGAASQLKKVILCFLLESGADSAVQVLI